MTSHTGRLYVLALAMLVLFLAWALVAARPWTRPRPSTQTQALALREQALRHETALVNQLLRRRRSAASAQPAVRVVTLPPLTITRTS